MTTKQKPETIDVKAFAQTHRQWDDMNELVKAMARLVTVMSWGAHAWTRMSPYVLRFAVNGHHHRGHVYLVPNHSDLFDIFFTTSRGTIKHTETGIFVDGLVDTIDRVVERIPEYKQ